MRIVHIITRLIVGGAQENTILSCQGQHRRGHDVTLITGPPLGPEGSLMDAAAAGGYAIEVIDDLRRALLPGKDFRAYRHLKHRLRDLRPDVVHTHSSKAGIIGRWAAHRAGCGAIVHTIHGLAFTASTRNSVNGFYKFLERTAAPLTSKIVCVADAMREQSLAAGIGRRDQYVTIYSGMNTAPFIHPPAPRQEVRRRLALGEDALVAGTIARLFELKGHDDLFALAPDLCAKIPRLRFLWVGDGVLRQTFEDQMTRLGLRDRFVLTGLVRPDEVPDLIAASDILVHPSRREGLARALPQANLAGKPAIAYDIDGNREGLIHEKTGFIIPPFDRSKLADAMVRLCSDAALRDQMGAAGREFALARFDAKVMVDRLLDLYRQLTGKD